MKLLLCKKCKHIFSLTTGKLRSCDCGETSGMYTDEINAFFVGPAITLGFSNPSFIEAVKNQPESGWGKRFEAFVIPKKCDTFMAVVKKTVFKVY